MPSSSARCTHASAASSSTCDPWVSQLPYEIAETFMPPRFLNSMSRDSSQARMCPMPSGQQRPTADVSASASPGRTTPPRSPRSSCAPGGRRTPTSCPPDAIPSGPEAVDAAAAAWRDSLNKPGDARNRVLVALERNRVVGFAITGPASDPDCDPVADGELQELTVDPAERGKGHGSRLLQAAAETLQADRFTRAVTLGAGHRRRPARVPHRGRLGTRQRAPRARPRRHGRHDGSSRSGCTPPWCDPR